MLALQPLLVVKLRCRCLPSDRERLPVALPCTHWQLYDAALQASTPGYCLYPAWLSNDQSSILRLHCYALQVFTILTGVSWLVSGSGQRG